MRTNDSRQRMVVTAAAMLSERGAPATGLRDVAERSGVSRGSIGHHFPDGKIEMVADSVAWAGERAASVMRAVAAQHDAEHLVAAIIGIYRAGLLNSHFSAGCPVGAVAAGEYGDDRVREAVAGAFGAWQEILEDVVRRSGCDDERAASLATLLVSSVEGALLLCRAHRSTRPLDRIERELVLMLRMTLSKNDG